MIWNIRDLSHAYQERPPTRYVVDKFLAEGSLNIVYGAPATMKSMLLADMCAAVVGGMSWLPGCYGHGEGVEVDQNAVLWIDMDNGTRRTDERIDAVSRSRNLPADAPFYYVSMPVPSLQLHTSYTWTEQHDDGSADERTVLELLIGFAQLVHKLNAKIVVIDNLGLITGDVDENSAEMASIMGHLRIIAERTDAAIVLVHHQRKGGAAGGRAGDALRGHSSIEAAVDLALHVVRETDQPEITITSTKTRGVDVPTVTARFNYTHKPNTHDLATAWFDGISNPTAGEDTTINAIYNVLDDDGALVKTELALRTKALIEMARGVGKAPGINKIRSIIDQALADGLLNLDVAENNAKVISRA